MREWVGREIIFFVEGSLDVLEVRDRKKDVL